MRPPTGRVLLLGVVAAVVTYFVAAGALYLSAVGACEDPGIGAKDDYCELVRHDRHWLVALAFAMLPALAVAATARGGRETPLVVTTVMALLLAVLVPLGVAPLL